MSMEGLKTVAINYESDDLPKSVKELRPAVYMDGNSFCCILGPDPQTGIFGCGNDQKTALEDWDKHLKERMAISPENDDVVEFVRDNMDAVHWKVR
jgi:hypothetical protein